MPASTQKERNIRAVTKAKHLANELMEQANSQEEVERSLRNLFRTSVWELLAQVRSGPPDVRLRAASSILRQVTPLLQNVNSDATENTRSELSVLVAAVHASINPGTLDSDPEDSGEGSRGHSLQTQ